MYEKDVAGTSTTGTAPNPTDAARTRAGAPKPTAVIGAACRRLRAAVEVGAEAIGQVIRGQGVKRSNRALNGTKTAVRLEALLNRIKADARNHGMRVIMASPTEADAIGALSDTDVLQAEPVLRALHAELCTIRAYAHERLRAIQAGQRGADVTLLMLAIETFKSLDRAVEEAVARLPATRSNSDVPVENATPAPRTDTVADGTPQVVWRPRAPRFKPPKDGWG